MCPPIAYFQSTIAYIQSTNGLFINAIQLEANKPYRLVDGDRVSFGPPNQSQFCYQFRDNISENNSNNSCVSYELSSINLPTIPVIPIVTHIQTTTTSVNNPLTLSSSLHFNIEPNQSRTISVNICDKYCSLLALFLSNQLPKQLTTSMPTRSGLSYSSSSTRVTHSSSGGPSAKKVASRKASSVADTRDSQPLASFVEHDYSRSSSNRSVDKNNKNKRLSSLKLKDNRDSSSSSKSKASKISEFERKLIAKEREKLEKSKKSLEQQKTMDRLKFKRKEEQLKKKQKELERKERETKKREEEIQKLQKELIKEKKRLSEKASEESLKSSAKRKLRSSSTRESVDTKRQCIEDSKKNAIEEIFESELTCSICSEYFIEAVNLNCSHTFCQTCIDEWKHTKGTTYACPICRATISSQNRELILDKLIDQFVVKMNPHLKEYRTKLADERKKRLEKKVTQQNTARMSTTARGNDDHVYRVIAFWGH